jgi:hypothetical protein
VLFDANSVFINRDIELHSRFPLPPGTSANVIRAAFLTSAQLGTYDTVKNNFLVGHLGFEKDAGSTHLAASLIASVASTTAGNPADVVKTRVMNEGLVADGGAVESSGIKGSSSSSSASSTSSSSRISSSATSISTTTKANSTSTTAQSADSSTTKSKSATTEAATTRATSSLRRRQSGPLFHCKQILKHEGLQGFMKGWTASYCRIGPHSIVSLLLVEKVRKLIGVGTY